MSFELNKILGAFLGTCLILVIIGTLENLIYKQDDSLPMPPERLSYKIATDTNNTPLVDDITLSENSLEEELNIAQLIDQADIDLGLLYSKKCTACHSFDEARNKKIGPPLIDVYERKIAIIEGYAYSKTFQNLNGIWDLEALDGFLKQPKEWAPGTKMSFVGIKKTEDRANLIAYLKSLIKN